MKDPYTGGWMSWYDGMARLQEQTARLEREAAELRSLLEALRERIDRLEARPTTTIERVEYKFDQLKVERLDGALHIGMPANGGGGDTASFFPAQFGAGDGHAADGGSTASLPDMTGADESDPVYEEALQEVNRYLDTAALPELERLETEFGIGLDSHHRSIVVADLRHQIGPRLRYYLQPIRPAAASAGASSKRSAGEAASLAIADLTSAMRNYLSRLKG